MVKVTALRGFEWHPSGKRERVLEGQSIEVTEAQAKLLADHGHVAAPSVKAAPAPAPSKPIAP